MVDKKIIKSTIALISLVLIFLVMFIAGNQSLLTTLAVYIAMLLVAIFIYNSKQYQKDLIGISKKNLFRSFLFAFLLAGVFLIVTKFFPGASIGLPLIPQAISDTIRQVIIVGFAPIVESIFQVVMFAVLLGFGWKITTALFGQALLFSMAHIAAYISGFYSYPTFVQGVDAVTANMGSFIAAFIFAFVGMYVLIKPKIRNITFLIVFHALVNLIILNSLSIVLIT